MILEFHLTVAVLTALFLHVVEDFHLQGLLADMKQKSWWLNNVFSKGFDHKYDKDYLAALALHGFE